MKHDKSDKTPKEPSVLDAIRAKDGVIGNNHLPPVEGAERDELGNPGGPPHGLSGHAGSGKDATLESVKQSESDRAAGKSS